MPDLLECGTCGFVWSACDSPVCPYHCDPDDIDKASIDGLVRYANEILADAMVWLRAVEGNGQGDSCELTKGLSRLELLGGILDDLMAPQEQAAMQREPSHG